MTDRPRLRPVTDDSPALTREEVNKRGNELVSQAREAAITAIARSMHPEFVARTYSLNRAGILGWRGRARTARDAWQAVDDLLSEVLHELDKTLTAEREGMELVVVPDGRPGRYRTEWAPKPAPVPATGGTEGET